MNDLMNDGSAGDDNALFASVTAPEINSGDQQVQSEPGIQPEALQPPGSSEQQPPATVTPEPAIPPSRLREEAEARRAAERELDQLRGQMAAMQRQFAPQPQTQQAEPFESMLNDPRAYVRQEAQQVVDPFVNAMHFNNRVIAGMRYGDDKVAESAQEFDRLHNAGQIHPAQYQQVMSHPNPFIAAHELVQNRKVLTEVGVDPTAYRNRILEDALKDPAFQKRVFESARTSAQQSGNTIVRPAVSSTPSLSRIGSAALPEGQAQDVSDAELFQTTTSRKRG